jgi:hypothetical protein
MKRVMSPGDGWALEVGGEEVGCMDYTKIRLLKCSVWMFPSSPGQTNLFRVSNEQVFLVCR